MMRTIVITGANSGIGFQAARLFAKAGDRLVLLCRPGEKSERALKFIKEESNNPNLSLIEADLSELASIERAIDQIRAETEVIDVLINNAGLQRKQYSTDIQGVELSLAVNFRAPFVLAEGLRDSLNGAYGSKVINVVSELYRNGKFPVRQFSNANKYNASKAYADSKLATVLMSHEMARRYGADNITVSCLHPGVLATDALRDYPKFMIKLVKMFLEKPEIGGQRIYQLATSNEEQYPPGAYIYKDEVKVLAKIAQDVDAQKAAWEFAKEIS